MAQGPDKPGPPPRKPGEPPDERPRLAPRREGELATRERRQVARPPRFRVILFNDDYTPMEFVVALLEEVFGKSPTEATQLMLKIHRSGNGTAGVYSLEVAETKVKAVHKRAEQRGYPLRAGAEPE